MTKENKIYYTVYIITHKISKQYYIGRHITTNLEDGYLGSGSSPILSDKINLCKEIIGLYDSSEIMIQKEIEMISENINDPLCVNMIIGDPTHGVLKHSKKSKDKISKGLQNYKALNLEKFLSDKSKAGKALKGYKQSQSHKENLSIARKGKPKPQEFKEKVSNTLKGRTLRPRETLCKKWKITNVITNETFIVEDRVDFCEKIHVNYSCFNVGTRNNHIYKNTWLCEKFL